MTSRAARRPRPRPRARLRRLRRTALAALVCLGTLAAGQPAGAQGGSGTQPRAVFRPLQDFLQTQGTFCLDDGQGGCAELVPGFPNLLVWSQLAPEDRCALVDYVGLLGQRIFTNTGGTVDVRPVVTGTVREQARSDGRADVHVRVEAVGAVTYVTQGCDLRNGPLEFGHTLPEVQAGQQPARGTSRLDIRFVNNAPGAPLPDLLQLIQEPTLGQVPLVMTFRTTATGPLRPAFGVPDGTPGRLTINNDIDFARPDSRRERIDLRRS
ncbi:hypothetical protein ABZ924_31610 [Streptomyces sp. NPDC046876]|uniref:hypothetical protein n=1 Tax=Streptomyces sp. NPDC046876 TaxID=3155616 RepID=UPI00340CDFC6